MNVHYKKLQELMAGLRPQTTGDYHAINIMKVTLEWLMYDHQQVVQHLQLDIAALRMNQPLVLRERVTQLMNELADIQESVDAVL